MVRDGFNQGFVSQLDKTGGESKGDSEGEGWSGECGRSVPSRQIVKPARRRRTRVAEENVLGACPYVHVRVLSEEVPFTRVRVRVTFVG